MLNIIKKDFINSKSENHKLELELNKKDKVIEDIAQDSRNDGVSYSPLDSKYSKAKEVR